MIEIIPNWHPIFVHFTVGVFTTTFGFYVLAYLFKYIRIIPVNLGAELEIVARWCLWISALITIITVIAGFHAYNTISRHDNISHIAMIDHRNWALPTAGMIILLALWSMWRYYKNIALNLIFLIALIITQGMLSSTAWHGAEVVYRYGIGVLSLPKQEGKNHSHGTEIMNNPSDHAKMPSVEEPPHQHTE